MTSLCQCQALIPLMKLHRQYEVTVGVQGAGVEVGLDLCCRYILFICILVSVCLTCLISSLSVDMLHSSSVPVLSTDHSPNCGESACRI